MAALAAAVQHTARMPQGPTALDWAAPTARKRRAHTASPLQTDRTAQECRARAAMHLRQAFHMAAAQLRRRLSLCQPWPRHICYSLWSWLPAARAAQGPTALAPRLPMPAMETRPPAMGLATACPTPASASLGTTAILAMLTAPAGMAQPATAAWQLQHLATPLLACPTAATRSQQQHTVPPASQAICLQRLQLSQRQHWLLCQPCSLQT